METLTLELTRNGNGLWDVTQKPATPALTFNADGSQPPKYRLEPADGGSGFYAVALHNIFHGDGSIAISAGTRSGWLASDRSLSQHGTCWTEPDTKVKDYARVAGYSRLRRRAVLADNAFITGHATIAGDAQILGSAQLEGYAQVYGRAVVQDGRVQGNARLEDNARAEGGGVLLDGNTILQDNAIVRSEEDLFISQGCFGGDMLVTASDRYLVVSSAWGPVLVAPTASGQWTGRVGCQTFNNFAELHDLADSNIDESDDFARQILGRYMALVRRSLKAWGIDKDIIDETTEDRDM
jgi:hypothetical protein